MDAEFYKGVLDALTDGVYFVDQDRKITYWNKAAERLSGYAAEEVVGKGCADNLLRHVDADGNKLCVEGCPLKATIDDGTPRETHVFMHHKFGHRVPVFVRASPIRDESGAITGAVEIFAEDSNTHDILREIENLRQEVLRDKLTDIGNRRYAEISLDRLDQAMAESGVPFGVLFVDIDHFKNVNDTYGHPVGDRVLTMVSMTLDGGLRPLDVVCRWGGEEFVVLVPNTNARGLAQLAERLRMLVENSWIEEEDVMISVTASFGGAVSTSGEAARTVLERADKQVYLSKEGGRNCVFIDGKRSE